jgi:hypothetical protein
MHRRTLPRLGTLATCSAIAGLLGAGDASAATLANSNGTLTYTAVAGRTTNVTVTEAGSAVPDTVTITRAGSDDDPISGVPATCATADSGTTWVCTGVSALSMTLIDGNDTVDASGLPATPVTLDGGTGKDVLYGGAAADRISGGDNSDTILGGGGNDTLDAGGGADNLDGQTGTDKLSGGTGNDTITQSYSTVTNAPAGAAPPEQNIGDSISGSDGFDTLNVSATTTDQHSTANASDDTATPLNVSVSIDDQANDGATGQKADVHSDVEAVAATAGFFTPAGGNETLVGSAGANQLTGGTGNDSIDGGAGNDVLTGGAGDDSINAKDGYADFVSCGAGTDTATVDSLDTVSSDCEKVTSTQMRYATEDAPPAINLTAPTDGVRVTTKAPTMVTATATDDRAVSSVLYTINGRLVCSEDKAPYTCSYQPQGKDVGRTTILAAAVDSSQQTAVTQRTITVPRFNPHRFSAYVTPRGDHRGARRFTAKGRLFLPGAVKSSEACGNGVVHIQVKAAGRTLSSRRAYLQEDCTYRSTVTFHNTRRFGGHTRLRYYVRFGGNSTLRHTRTHHYTVHVG